MLKMRISLLFLAVLVFMPVRGNYDRPALTGYIDQYFKALLANNVSEVPLAKSAKITLNGDIKSISETFWAHAESVTFRFDIVNTRRGDTGTEAVIKNSDGSLTMFMLRMKIEVDKIAEIEAISHDRLVAEFFAIRSGLIQEIQAVIVNRPDEMSTGWVADYGPDRVKFQRE